VRRKTDTAKRAVSKVQALVRTHIPSMMRYVLTCKGLALVFSLILLTIILGALSCLVNQPL
jgi:hypothetical protein